MKKQMTVKAFNEKRTELVRGAREIAMQIEAAVVISGDTEKLIRAAAGLYGLLEMKRDVTEGVRKSVYAEMTAASGETCEVDEDWGPYYEEGKTYVRAAWFVERIYKETQGFAEAMESMIAGVVYGDEDTLEDMEGRLEDARRLYEEIVE